MAREREKKSSAQQLWQAKPRGVDAGAAALSAAEKAPSKEELRGVYGEGEQGEGFMRSGSSEGSVVAMKELQARTKVVVRHLPPSLSEQVFLDQIESKYGDSYTWVAFYSGKSSLRRLIHSRAYINFKFPENVFEFCEDFAGHVFVNEKGTQYKAVVEYSPYQRVPDVSLKKDIREGTILKDPEYLEFLEMLAKPIDYLPSAEVQLERREAEKAASMASRGVKESVIVTPLMEYVRQRRAAKAAPQRSSSLSRKQNVRGRISGGSSKNFSAKKRGVDRSKAYIQIHSMDGTMTSKNDGHSFASPKEFQGDFGAVLKRRSYRDVVKDKKAGYEASVSTPTFRGDSTQMGTDGVKEFVGPKEAPENPTIVSESSSYGVDARKDVFKKEILRRKQLVEKARDKEALPEITSLPNKEISSISQKHRPPVSPKITSAGLRASSPGGSVPISSTIKQLNRRENASKSSRGGLGLSKEQGVVQADYNTQYRDQPLQAERRILRPQLLRTYSKDQSFSISTSLSPSEAEVGFHQLNLGPKTPTDEVTSTPSAAQLPSPISGSDRQSARRVKNKDRPDRPVWTPRRRADSPQGADTLRATPMKLTDSPGAYLLDSESNVAEKGDKSSYNRNSVSSMGERESVQQFGLVIDHESIEGNNGFSENYMNDNLTLGASKTAFRRDHIIQGGKELDALSLPPDAGKSSRRMGGASVFAANEKQMWVAKSPSGP